MENAVNNKNKLLYLKVWTLVFYLTIFCSIFKINEFDSFYFIVLNIIIFFL